MITRVVHDNERIVRIVAIRLSRKGKRQDARQDISGTRESPYSNVSTYGGMRVEGDPIPRVWWAISCLESPEAGCAHLGLSRQWLRKIRRGDECSVIPSRLCQYLCMQCTYIATGKRVLAETSVPSEKFSTVLCFTKDCLRLYFTQIYMRVYSASCTRIKCGREGERSNSKYMREFWYPVVRDIILISLL